MRIVAVLLQVEACFSRIQVRNKIDPATLCDNFVMHSFVYELDF